MRVRRALVIGAALAIAPVELLHAQTASAQAGQEPSRIPGAFRSRVTLVPLDIRVLDHEGRPVTDLTENDFTVLEEDVPQKIVHFSHHVLTARPQETRLRMRQATADIPAPPTRRVFLLVLGRGRLQYPARGVDAAIEFVRERLLPQDQVAVLAYNRATDFTTDRAEILAVLERFRERHEEIEAELVHRVSGLAAVYGGREIPESLQSKIDELFEDPDSPRFRRLPAAVVDIERLAADTRRETQDLSPGGAYFDVFVGQNVQTLHDLGNIYAGIEYLRYIEGEKHLVFLTESGLFVPRVENDVTLADAASDARVVIDTIKTGGVFADPPGLRWLSEQAWAHNFAAMSLRNVSRLSGGQSSLFRYASDAFRRIDAATRSAYTIAYSPSNTDWDGKFRRIKVKVNRRGVVVLARRGYFAREQLVPFDRRQFLTYTRVVSATAYPGDLSDIPLKVTATHASGSELRLDLRLAPSRMRFTEAEGRMAATLEVAVFCADRRREAVCEQWQNADVTLTKRELEQAREEGILYTVHVPLTGEPRDVKVVVYDFGSDILGSTSIRLR